MGSIQRFIRERKAGRLGSVAIDLKYAGKFEEAARTYEQQAEMAKPDNELIYAGDCEDAFEMWMKAGDVGKALVNARNALSGYSRDEIWLKGDDSYIDHLLKMVNALFKADHANEADTFLTEINTYLKTIGVDPVTVTLWGVQHEFPPTCPHCDAPVTYHGNQTETECPFCKGIIHCK